MGRTSKRKTCKCEEADQYDEYDDELYRPFLIHCTTYVILTDQLLSLMPSERNVLLTMNEYSLNDINPTHTIIDDDSPTHVIIFCIRFIGHDIFQPIGGLLIYKQEDQSLILAECLKAYINDLWKLGLHVIATVSPSFETFKGILNHLVDIKNVNSYPITYSVAPFKEIVHVYDIQFLLIKLQNLFKQGDIKFVEGSREFRATWSDISLVLNLCAEFKILSNYLLDNKDVSRRVHIFTQQIFEQLLELEAQGALSENAEGCAVLLNCVRTYLQFSELDLVDLSLMHDLESWNSLAHILQTMTFQKSKKRTCTKIKPTEIHTIATPTRRKLEFQIDSNTDTELLSQRVDEKLFIGEQENFNQINDITATERTIFEDKVTLIDSEQMQTHQSCSQNNKQKKGGKKKKRNSESIMKSDSIDQSSDNAIRSDNAKAEKQNNTPKNRLDRNTYFVVTKETNSDKTILQHTKDDSELGECLIENKPYYKTDTLLNIVNTKKINADKSDNKDVDCDNNNDGSENIQHLNNHSTTLNDICDNKTNINTQKIKQKKIEEENFDVVINDAQKFFECFLQCSTLKTHINDMPVGTNNSQIFSSHAHSNIKNNECYSNVQQTSEKSDRSEVPENTSKYKHLFLYDGKKKSEGLFEFSSQNNEETENCITKSCDKVPNVELLNNLENDVSNDFEQNNVTHELLCTVYGMKKIIDKLTQRRVKLAKPDAFIVEHIDFLVSLIKRDKNKMNPVYYYGHNYGFLNSEVAFVTLENKNGLYLVSK